MTTSNHFIELWQKLESTNHHGIVKIAYSEDSRYRIYATMSCPDHVCGFAISFDDSIKVELKPFRDLRQLSVELLTDTSYDKSSLLLVQLRNVEKRDVFAILCENLVSSANQVNEERLMLKIVINKLCEWKSLFDKLSNGPLSKPQQQGLFGELYFIKSLLNNKKEAIEYNIISTWQGMEEERSIRDFQGQNWVVEVKTTSTNSPQKVTINGERQLDDSLVDNLLLYHCSVDIYNEKVIRATQGAVFKVKVFRENIIDTIEKVKNKGINVYGTALENGSNLNSFERVDQYCLVLGNEGNGVSKEILDVCDKNIFIEMNKELESLNVAIAGAIIMHYFY